MKGLILSNTAKFTFLHKSRQLAASLFSISYGYKRYYSELKVRSWHKADRMECHKICCERSADIANTILCESPGAGQSHAGLIHYNEPE